MPAIDESRGSKSVEVRSVWGIYDDRLQFVSQHDSLLLSESLDAGDVSQAWLVWSRAAEMPIVFLVVLTLVMVLFLGVVYFSFA